MRLPTKEINLLFDLILYVPSTIFQLNRDGLSGLNFANVSLKFSNLNNRRVTAAYVAILLSFMQLIEEYLLATFFFIIPDPYDINGQLRQKSMTSYRCNERCQRP